MNPVTNPKQQRNAARNPRRSQERILSAATTEFAANGFAGARVDVIARRACINKRMLYHYFGDKKELFRAVLRRKLAERTAWLAAAPQDPVERLPFWYQIATRDPEWIRLLEWEALQWGDEKVIDEEPRAKACRSALQQFRKMQSDGLLPSGLDAGQLLLSMMALTAYPMAFPQQARLVTGLSVLDPRFQQAREKFLRQFAAALKGANHVNGNKCARRTGKGKTK